MFCPKCRYEYELGLDRCPDCNVALVVELPPEDELEYTELRKVLVTADLGVLTLAKSILDDAGIFFHVKGETTRQLFASGFIEVQVRPEDEEDARQLLDDMKRDLKATDPRRSEMEDYEDEEDDEKGEE